MLAERKEERERERRERERMKEAIREQEEQERQLASRGKTFNQNRRPAQEITSGPA